MNILYWMGEISKLLSKGVITKAASAKPGQIVSSIFLHPKKDGFYHLILNLKQFNTDVAYIENGFYPNYCPAGDTKLFHGIIRLEGCLLFPPHKSSGP